MSDTEGQFFKSNLNIVTRLTMREEELPIYLQVIVFFYICLFVG
jgi:hypothetical protein